MPDDLISTNGSEPPVSSELTLGSFRLSETGLIPQGTPTIDQWLEVGTFINKSEKLVHFWIGDWLNYGDKAWGDRYQDLINTTKYDYGTLRDDKWVASRIPPERRQPTLSFTHHREVASLPPDEQDELLAIAVAENLNREKFRKVVRLHGQPLQDQTLSGRPDKQNAAQKLIDAMLSLSRQVSDTAPDQFTPEERLALTDRARELKQNLEAFIALYGHQEDTGS